MGKEQRDILKQLKTCVRSKMDDKIVEEIIKILTKNKRKDLADLLKSYFDDVNDEDYTPPQSPKEPPEEYFERNCPGEKFKVGRTDSGHYFLKD